MNITAIIYAVAVFLVVILLLVAILLIAKRYLVSSGNVKVTINGDKVYDVAMQLSVYLGLIITNCILMGRLEAFAMTNNAWDSLLDGLGNGLGYAIILVIVAFVRELLGSGQLLGFQVIPQSFYDAGYENCGMMLMPAMALILVGCVIWVHRSINEKNEK